MVVSSPITGAAIIGGELILSLPTGQIINCGLVQGPPGLKGAMGPTGPKGDDGADGLSLRTGTGFPDSSIGVDGEVFYSTTLVAIFLKTNGTWGAPVYLRPKDSQASTGQRLDGKTTKGAGSGSRFLMGGGPFPTAPGNNTAGLDPINKNNQPLAAATTRVIAGDSKGYVFHVLLHALVATGSYYAEVVCTRDELGNTGHVVAWETDLGTGTPNLTFTTAINGNQLELTVVSDIDVDKLRGKIIYV